MTTTWNIGGQLFEFDQPKIMGILNITPDSFFDGGEHFALEAAITKAEKMIEAGVDIIDIGGCSSRPGAIEVSENTELDRVIPAIKAIREKYKTLISIDTFRTNVALKAIEAGANIVNDISAGDDDPAMLPMISDTGVPFIAMHKQGTPSTMQINPSYHNVVIDILDYFIGKKRQFIDLGIKDWMLDPGFGFGKTLTHNYQVLANLAEFKLLEVPILAGVSRKSMIYKPLNINAADALLPTAVVQTMCLMNGANVLRVHDVEEAIQCKQLFELYSEHKKAT